MKRFVAVAGNIGVGKSTLVERLAEELGWEPFYEPVGDNPYLADFYDDMETWGFHSQIFFLTRRLRMHRMLTEHTTSAIQDRTVYEDAEVFAYNLSLQGHISDRDFETYHELYHVLTSFLPPPDLVVYLKADVDTLQARIATRGREYERSIPEAYLRRLNELYNAWIDRFALCPILTVPADDLDYATNKTHLALIVEKINDKLAGKEEVVFGMDEVARVNGSQT